MKETIDDIFTELSCKGWQEAVHEIEKALEEKDKEAEHLKCIISNIKEDYLSEYKEKVDLEERINKAIEYIERQDKWYKNEEYKLLKEKDLLNILQGVDKE